MSNNERTNVAVTIAVVCVLLGSCASTLPRAAGGVSDLPGLIGWMHGGCIALSDDRVAPGTKLTLVSVDSESRNVMTAKVAGRATGSSDCPALLEDRRTANQEAGWSFYLVEPRLPSDFAIGLVALAPEGDPETYLDLDGDGQQESFGYCTTAEGLRFAVEPSSAGGGEALWSGYYYLGYDLQANCPDH